MPNAMSDPSRNGMRQPHALYVSVSSTLSSTNTMPIAGIVFVLLSVLDTETYSAWGWRIPFLLGSLMAFGMLIYYRSYIADSPVWKQPAQQTSPLKEIFIGEQHGALVQVFVLMSGLWLFTDMAIPVLTGQLKVDTH